MDDPNKKDKIFAKFYTFVPKKRTLYPIDRTDNSKNTSIPEILISELVD